MQDSTRSAAGVRLGRHSPLPLDRAFEKALLQLHKSRDRPALIACGRRLLEALAPGVRIELASAGECGAIRSAADAVFCLPLHDDAGNSLKVTLPEGTSRARCERQIALVASLVGAQDDQLQALKRLNDNVHQLKRAERLQHALYSIAELASSGRDLGSVLHSMHQTINGLMYAENFYIALVSEDGASMRFPYVADTASDDPPRPDRDYPMTEMQRSLTWHVINAGKPLMGSMEEITKQIDGDLKRVGPESTHWLGVPLWHDDHAIGALAVQSYRQDRHYNEDDKSLLTYVAQHVRTALERHQAHAALNRRVAERTAALENANRVLKEQVVERLRSERLQAALFRIAELAGSSSGLDAFYRDVHDVIAGLLHARNFYIAVLGADGETLEFPYSVDEFDLHRAPRKSGHGLTEYVLRSREPLLCDHDKIVAMTEARQLEPSGTIPRCWLGVPLMVQDEAAGVLAVQSYSDTHRYDIRDQELLMFVSYHVGNALERKRSGDSLRQANTELEQRVQQRTKALAEANQSLRQQILKRERTEQRLKYQAMHDSLTGLPNRNLLLHRLAAALEAWHEDPRKHFAVLFLDLDRFKVINDSVGHMLGDDLLFEAGERIRGCLKGQDVVARLGGDEFAVLLENISTSDQAGDIAERIINALNKPFRLGAKELYTTTSIGIAMAAPHYRRAEELLRDADTAMYRAKAEGRQRHVLFDEAMREQATQLQEIENDLRRALTGSEFEPWFQPIVRLDDQRVAGFEALARWNHPVHGTLLPQRFLSVAGDSGLDERLDWIMFDLVLSLTPQLARDGRYISVNLSARQFRATHDLHGHIMGLLHRHAVEPEQIRIEITEHVLLEDPTRVRETLAKLLASGIGVSLDDFGTGYSSLSYLHQFPLNALKIDQSFVADLGDDDSGSTPVVRAIKALADSQHMQVIAEGIETERQAGILKQLGCEYGQGFLYAQPQPAHDWLQSFSET